MSKNNIKITWTRFIYSIIDFFATHINYNFEISSYLINLNNQKDIKFSKRNICNFISKNNNSVLKNRFFLVISFDDSSFHDLKKSYTMLYNILNIIDKDFYTSNILDLLEMIEPMSKFRILSKHNNSKLNNYIIIIFNIPTNSSIEVIISTHNLDKKLLEVDESGDILEYHSKLNKNIKEFEIFRKNEIS